MSYQSKILVVEDQVDLRSIITEELLEHGYLVDEAENGQQGLSRISEYAPDLIISDINMPILDGYGMLNELRSSDSASNDTPFIFLSALTDKSNVLSGLEYGADDYVTKPIDFDILLAKIEARLRQVSKITKRHNHELIQLCKALGVEDPVSHAETQSPADDGTERRKSPRHKMSVPAVVQSGKYATPCTIVDGSREGCRIWCENLEFLSDLVELRPKGVSEPMRGRLVWRNEEKKFAGIEFS